MSVVYREGPTMRGGVRNEHKLHTSHKYRQPFGASNLVRDQSATGYMRYKERQAQTTEEEAATHTTITTATVYLADTDTHTGKTQRKWAKLRAISKLFILKLARLCLPQAAPTTSAPPYSSCFLLLPPLLVVLPLCIQNEAT